MKKLRKINQLIEPQLVIEGADVLLKRSIAPRRSNEYDPFLLFDHFAFNDPTEGPIRGFPPIRTVALKPSPTCSKGPSDIATAWKILAPSARVTCNG